MGNPNVENPHREASRSNYPPAGEAHIGEFADPKGAVEGFGRLFNRVVKNVAERLPI